MCAAGWGRDDRRGALRTGLAGAARSAPRSPTNEPAAWRGTAVRRRRVLTFAAPAGLLPAAGGARARAAWQEISYSAKARPKRVLEPACDAAPHARARPLPASRALPHNGVGRCGADPRLGLGDRAGAPPRMKVKVADGAKPAMATPSRRGDAVSGRVFVGGRQGLRTAIVAGLRRGARIIDTGDLLAPPPPGSRHSRSRPLFQLQEKQHSATRAGSSPTGSSRISFVDGGKPVGCAVDLCKRTGGAADEGAPGRVRRG